MPVDLPDIGTLVIQAIAAIIMGIVIPTIPLVYKLFKTWMEAKIAAIAVKEVREVAEFAFKRLDFLVCNVVDEITQTSTEQTGLTEEEKKRRKILAFRRIMEQLTESNKKVLTNEVKDLNRYILTKIEATRFFQKTLQ